MDAAERSALIDAWIEFGRLSASRERAERLKADEVYGWANNKMVLLPHHEPELAWTIILEILARNPDDDVRTKVAAGPFQVLVWEHSEIFSDRIEEQARRSAKFRELLGGLISMPNAFFRKIQHLIPPGH